MKHKVLVVGASTNPGRYSYLAIRKLLRFQYEVEAISVKNGQIDTVVFQPQDTVLQDIDTITLYVSAVNQKEYYATILSMKPRRVIFNPGTENPVLEDLLSENGIEAIHHCTLVMLDEGSF